MHKWISDPGEHPPGQALIVFAVFLLALVAVMALALDGGNIYLHRRRAQNAADAGALAGARILALSGSSSEAYEAAELYAIDKNNADRCDITVSEPGVTVVAYRDVPMTFARLVGLAQVTVRAQATARWAPVGSVARLVPIAVKDFDYIFTHNYTIWDDDVADPPDPLETDTISGNNRGWLNLDCLYPAECGDAGADLTTEWMLNGYTGNVATDSWYRGSSGIMTRPLAITQARIGDMLFMPIYDVIQDLYSGKAYYHIIKFAAFEVTQVYDTGNPKGLQGNFQYYTTSGPPSTGDDGGLRTVLLTR